MLASVEAMTIQGPALEAPCRHAAAHFVPPVPPSEMKFGAWLAERTPAWAATVRDAGRAGARSGCTSPGSGRPSPAARPAQPPAARLRPGGPRGLPGRRRGHQPAALAESGLFDFSSERSARQHVRDGRLTAADLGAWPWAVVDGKPLPRNWWADGTFALALGEWAIAGQSLTVVRAMRPGARRYTAAVRLPIA